jgi:hypothetical protein
LYLVLLCGNCKINSIVNACPLSIKSFSMVPFYSFAWTTGPSDQTYRVRRWVCAMTWNFDAAMSCYHNGCLDLSSHLLRALWSFMVKCLTWFCIKVQPRTRATSWVVCLGVGIPCFHLIQTFLCGFDHFIPEFKQKRDAMCFVALLFQPYADFSLKLEGSIWLRAV